MGIVENVRQKRIRALNKSTALTIVDDEADKMKSRVFSTMDLNNSTVVSDDKLDEHIDFRQNFVSEYGVDITFPAFYSYSGCLVPHMDRFIVSLGFHSIPRNGDETIQITKSDDDPENPSGVVNKRFTDLYDQTGQSIILKLMQAD